MAIVAGIDEAGYGPLLGPLVVTGVVFEVPDSLVGASLWGTLKRSISQRASVKELRLPVLDSKKLYSTKTGLGGLERAALVMLKTGGQCPSTLGQLLGLVAPRVLDDLPAYPWYREFDRKLPVKCSEGEIATRANAVGRDMVSTAVCMSAVLSEVLLEGHYNRLIADVRNKAVVSLSLVLRLVQQVFSRSGGQGVHVHVDRQGGRTHYREQLLLSFPDYHLRIVEEGETRSAYELTRATTCHQLDFVTDGESRHLPIALAGIYSKYIRELLMGAFNAFWGRQVSGLRPTAGYYTDARRFLHDIEGAVESLGIDPTLLVRSR